MDEMHQEEIDNNQEEFSGEEEISDPEYEDLVELDEDIVLPVSSQLFKELPHAKFTQANKENFSEENQSCTIC